MIKRLLRLSATGLMATGFAMAQDCSYPTRVVRTHEPWLGSFVIGGANDSTVNLFCDLDVLTPVEITGLQLPLYDQGGGVSIPLNQVGNIAEVRIYMVAGSWVTHDLGPGTWGLAVPSSGQPERRGELLVDRWPNTSHVRNFKDAAGTPTPLLLQPGQYGVCLELVPTAWSGTAQIPGQTNVPLQNPGPLHPIIAAGSPTTASGPHLTLSNAGTMWSGWHQVDSGGNVVPASWQPPVVNQGINLGVAHSPQVAGLANRTPYGVGCYDSPRMLYERVPGNQGTSDLLGTSWTLDFTQDISGGRYVVTPGGPSYDLATAVNNGINIRAMTPTSTSSVIPWDDSSLVYTLPPTLFPSGFPYPGGVCTAVTIQSNGTIMLDTVTANGSTWAPFGATTSLEQYPQLAPFFGNMRVTTASEFRLEAPSPNGGLRVTWHNVRSSNSTRSDFQAELLPNGDVYFAYGSQLANDSTQNVVFVGFSSGNGQPVTIPIDWSAITSQQTGSAAVAPVLDLSADPVLGSTVDVVVAGFDPSTAQPIGGFVSMGFAAVPGGLSLQGYGLPGCRAFVDPGSVLFSVLLANPSQTELRWPWQVPTNAQGVSVRLQAGTFTPTVHNTAGIVLTNALCAQMGQ